jgi:predicted O-linked N-acetylglucosamine transferase (SPINDLY family)
MHKATNASVEGAGRTQPAYAAAYRMFVNGRLNPAEAALRRILVHHPQSFDALLLLAEIRKQKHQLRLAKGLLRRAIALRPRSPRAHHRLGGALGKQRRFKEAERCFRRALVLDPGFAEAEVELGQALFELGYLDDAAKSFRRALALKPDLAQAHYRLGNVLVDQGQVAAAQDCYRRAIALRPEYAAAYGNLAFAMNYEGEVTPAEIYAAHRGWGAFFPPPENLNRTYANDRRPERRLRVGYVSGDFCDHPVNYFFEPLLASHNPSEIEVFCYCALDEVEEDAITARLKLQAEHWSRIGRWDDQSVAERIRADRIDILVDLSGHTAGGRLQVFALKPAPVQATWLGYLNTTGLAAMDYRITDVIADPEGEAEQFNREALVRLRQPFLCYRPYDNAPPVSAPPVLETGHITFGSFNNLPKLSPEVIKLWARLLHAVPGSRLVIKTVQMRDSPTAVQLRRRFAADGIEPDRIDLLKWRVRAADHLARYELVDIALDPFPFNGVTTTCEALWMGVPVVTLRGHRPCGRVGASLLTSVGLPELAAEDPESYVETAVGLGRDLSRLKELRFGMRDRMRASLLCNAPGFARAMEQAYRCMWQAWCAQAAPAEERSTSDLRL